MKHFFIDLASLSLMKVFPDFSGRINFIKPNFYVVSKERTFFFDNVGNIVDKIEMNRFSEFLYDKRDGHIFFNKDNFFISSASKYRFWQSEVGGQFAHRSLQFISFYQIKNKILKKQNM